jgi:hypothetical protein
MPSVKDLARVVIRENWPLGDLAFERAWSDLVAHPIIITAGPSLQPALAAGSTTKDKAIVVMAICVFVLERMTDDTTIRDLMPHFEKIAVVLGDKGVFVRIKKTLDAAYTGDTIITASTFIATAYTHQAQQHLIQGQVDSYRARRQNFLIFIHHQRTMTADNVGQVWVTKGQDEQSSPPPPKSERLFLSPLHYRILLHLLKNCDDEASRLLPTVIEQCWQDAEAAKTLRGTKNKLDRTALGDNQRSTFTKLSNILEPLVGSRVRTAAEVVFLDPWPATYCVIDERDTPTLNSDDRE